MGLGTLAVLGLGLFAFGGRRRRDPSGTSMPTEHHAPTGTPTSTTSSSPDVHSTAQARSAAAAVRSREVLREEEQRRSAPAAAALALRTYLEGGGAVRDTVRQLQQRMGMPARYLTGRVGSITREKARALGVELPPREDIPQEIRAAEG